MAEPAGKAFPLPDVSRDAARARSEAAAASEHSQRSAARVIEVEQVLAESKAEAFTLQESLATRTSQVEQLTQALDRADRVMAAMKASLSWRITAPLRALKQRRRPTNMRSGRAASSTPRTR